MSVTEDETIADEYWRDDDYYIADDEGEPRRLTRRDVEEFTRRRALLIACGVIFVVAFIVRFGFNVWLGDYPVVPESRDMYEYDQVARSLLDGKGYSKTWAFTNDRGETAVEYRSSMFRPPLYTFAVTFSYALTNRNVLAARILMSGFGSATCLLIFLVGRRVFSHKVGFLAGLIGAVYPFLWIPDGILMSESLYTMLLMYLIFRLYLLKEAVSAKNVILAGVTAGLVALTRTEGLIFTAMAALFVVVGISHMRTARRLGVASLIALIGLSVYAPWAWHTWTTFGTLAPSSTVGTMMAGNSNRASYYDRIYIGSWYYGGLQSDRDTLYRIRDPRENEKSVDDIYARNGTAYMNSHLEQLPLVLTVREMRAWDFWDPYTTARIEKEWGRPMWATYLGLILYYPALLLAAYGAWRFRRDWRELFPFYFLVGFFVVFSALTFGTVRFRTWVEPTIVLMATATGYGLTRGRFLERSAPLRELMARIRTDAPADESHLAIPERMERALRMREARAARAGLIHSTDRALLPEGEELEYELEHDLTEDEYLDFEVGELGEELIAEGAAHSEIDQDGVIHIVIDSEEGGDRHGD